MPVNPPPIAASVSNEGSPDLDMLFTQHMLTAQLAGGLDHATHAVFVATIPLAALIVVLAFLLPEHELRTSH